MKLVKTTLKRGEIAELYNVLATTNFDAPIHSKFRYVASKNVRTTKSEMDEINAAFPPPEELPKFQKERVDLFNKYKVKNDAEYKELPKEIKEELDKDLGTLDEKYKDVREEVSALDKEKNDFLDDNIEISLYKINIDFIPNISAQQQNKLNGWEIWSVIERIIEEEEEVVEEKKKPELQNSP